MDTTIDLARYVLRRADAACGHCGHKVLLLRPRDGAEGPAFWLCPHCGAITGQGGLIASPLDSNDQPVAYRGVLGA